MATYQFEKAEFDAGSLAEDLVAAGLPVDSVRGPSGGMALVSTTRILTAGEEFIAFSVAAAAKTTVQAAAARFVARAKSAFAGDSDESARRDRAIVLSVLDEVNDLRAWIMAFKSAVAAATNLANLQARVASLPNVPERTKQQAKDAVLGKIETDE